MILHHAITMTWTTFNSQLIALFIDIKYLVLKEHKVVIPDWELKKKRKLM